MSYSIYLAGSGSLCAHCGRRSDLTWNYTANVAPMWRAAGADLAGFHERRAGECAVVLREAIVVLRAQPHRFRAMNPPNGWGSYDGPQGQGLIAALDLLLAELQRYPDAIVQVSR